MGPDLKFRLREYFQHCRNMLRQRYYHKLLELMSPALRGEVAMYTHGAWIQQITFLCCDNEEERTRFIVQIALALDGRAYAPDELIYSCGEVADALYIVQRGIVAGQGSVMGAGRFFVEDLSREYVFYLACIYSLYCR